MPLTNKRKRRARRSAVRTDKATEKPITMTVPEAGRHYLRIGRVSSYAAAARGEIPTIRIGRLLRVPTAALEARLAAAGQAK